MLKAVSGLLAVGAVALATASPTGVPTSDLTWMSGGTHVVDASFRTVREAIRASGASFATEDNEVVERFCVRCHNDQRLRGNMSLEGFDADRATDQPELAERMIRKLQAGMMPPPGARRPEPDVLRGLVASLEEQLDAAASAQPNPGGRTFQRLNRAEYQSSIADLLELQIDAGDFLPLDTKSANFDNIADVQLLSATLTDGYLRAASEISRLAVGDPDVTAAEATYRVTRWYSQTEQVEGAPYGSRGGVATLHNFPADGEYSFRVSFHHETTGALVGSGRAALHTGDFGPEQVEISIDGEPVAVLDVNRWMHTSDPDGMDIRSEPVFVQAGPRQVSAAFIRRVEGPVQDLLSPHDWSMASTSIADAYGFTTLPHLRDLAISGPFDPTGVSETPSRRVVFTCEPSDPGEQRPCAESIVRRLAPKAYRRPLEARDVDALMALYDAGVEAGGFNEGVRMALEGILASPHFVFRFEEPTDDGASGDPYRISDVDLAARLSFFLWGTGPDDDLARAAREGRLSDPEVLEAEVRRMLRSEKSQALATRFGAQWLRLQDLEKIQPDVRVNPDFDEQLKEAMLEETLRFFDALVHEDRPVLDLFTADYTYVNERLARHYGMAGIAGERFRRVEYPDQHRRGLLGHGSILTLTSHADRTSPVLRGKWVMEVLLGTPPPPPPPDVPDLEATDDAEDGRFLTVRERMEMHRSNPSCNSCHRMIDPIGLALENFDVSGAWRIKDAGMPIDATGELYDGTTLASPEDLRSALMSRPIPLLRTFTENLMAYALGRRLEYYDMPVVRSIVSRAGQDDYRLSSFVLGVVQSDAFQMKSAPVAVDQEPEASPPDARPGEGA